VKNIKIPDNIKDKINNIVGINMMTLKDESNVSNDVMVMEKIQSTSNTNNNTNDNTNMKLIFKQKNINNQNFHVSENLKIKIEKKLSNSKEKETYKSEKTNTNIFKIFDKFNNPINNFKKDSQNFKFRDERNSNDYKTKNLRQNPIINLLKKTLQLILGIFQIEMSKLMTYRI